MDSWWQRAVWRVERFTVRHAAQGALILAAWGACLWFTGCATTARTTLHGETPMTASWYGKEQHHGPTACGQRYDMYAYTAAHRTLPMGTILSVRNPANGNSVRVTVTDRGPYIHGRDLDLSYVAARDLDLLSKGVARVYVNEVGHDSRYDHYWKHGVCPPVASEPSAPAARELARTKGCDRGNSAPVALGLVFAWTAK